MTKENRKKLTKKIAYKTIEIGLSIIAYSLVLLALASTTTMILNFTMI